MHISAIYFDKIHHIKSGSYLRRIIDTFVYIITFYLQLLRGWPSVIPLYNMTEPIKLQHLMLGQEHYFFILLYVYYYNMLTHNSSLYIIGCLATYCVICELQKKKYIMLCYICVCYQHVNCRVGFWKGGRNLKTMPFDNLWVSKFSDLTISQHMGITFHQIKCILFLLL